MLPPTTSIPKLGYSIQGSEIQVVEVIPAAIITDPRGMTTRGPKRVSSAPVNGPMAAAKIKPKAKAPAVSPRAQLNSAKMAGYKREKAVRAFTPTAIVAKAQATMAHP